MRPRGGHSTSPPRATASLVSSDAALNHCAVCAKRLHTFRRKHRCQTCRLSVCSRCLQVQRPRSPVSPRSRSLIATSVEPVEVCVRCCQREREKRQRQQLEETRRRRLQKLELQHFGPRPPRHMIRRRRSCGALKIRVETVTAVATATNTATGVEESQPRETCAICEHVLAKGDAVFTTACSHNFHWRCLKAIKELGNRQCPTCHVVITELQLTKECLHSRVFPGNRFCRDCGIAVHELVTRPQGIMTQRPQTSWSQLSRDQVNASVQTVRLLLLHLADYAIIGIVKLFLAIGILIFAAIQGVIRFPWLWCVNYLVSGCVRLLFNIVLHVMYTFHRLLQPRRVARTQRRPPGGRYYRRQPS